MNSNFAKITYFVALLLMSSAIYISTYWTELGVDIFPYISVDKLVLYALNPLIIKTTPVLVGMLISIAIFDKFFPYGGYNAQKEYDKQNGSNTITRADKIVRGFVFFVAFVFTPIILGVVYFNDKQIYYMMLPNVVAIFSFLLIDRILAYGGITNLHIDSKIVFISLYILVSSFSVAKNKSYSVLHNREFQYIIKSKEYYKFLGKAGEYHFFTTISNKGIIKLKYEDLKKGIYYNYDGNLRCLNDSIISKEIKK